MPCIHNFFGHHAHMGGENGLLPNWDANTLIIGTFNPHRDWVSKNKAIYFYGRPKNYFWDSLPRFASHSEIEKSNLETQLAFLQNNHIALTDLLISIEDAETTNSDHLKRIGSFKDDDLNIFKHLKWNIDPIKKFIESQNIKAVYFTKLGGSGIFEKPIVEIERFCIKRNIISKRLYTPSGQLLGFGKPRKYKLIHRWFNEDGGDQFPFLTSDFSLNNFPWN